MVIVPYRRNSFFMSKTLSLLAAGILAITTIGCTRHDVVETDKAEKKGRQSQEPLFSKGKKLGALKGKKLDEASGIAASVVNPDHLWTLNDSGNNPEIYLIDRQANIKQTYKFEGIANRDWEEISVGPGPVPGKNYVYVGDIGDNMAAHRYKYLYRLEEPVYTPAASDKVVVRDFDTLVFSLSDERRDTEAFMIDPATRDIYIISKWNRPVVLYQLNAADAEQDTAVARQVARLPMSVVVAADFSRDGSELLIKTLTDVFYWKRSPGTSVTDMLKQPGISLPYETEPQGESITWSADGKGYYTLSEQRKGEQIHLMYYERK